MKELANLLVVVFTLSCADESNQTVSDLGATGCDNGSARIAVYDTALQSLCGCQEGDGAITHRGQTFTCTISAGESVVFDFNNSELRHQILSTGSPSFRSSPLQNPESGTIVRIHGVTFDVTGTYEFEDAFIPELVGQIVVQ